MRENHFQTEPLCGLSAPLSGRNCPSKETTYSYDADGNLTGISSADGSLSIGHAGPVPTSVTWNGPVTGTVSIGRNALFQATSYSVGGQQITRDVDGDGVVSRVGALTIDRSEAGFVQGTTLGGPVTGGGVSVTDTVTPNELGEPLHYVATLQPGDGSAATGVEDVTYTRDNGGRITTVSETIANPLNPTTPDTRSARYTYDDLGRLACVYHDGQLVAHHVYDDNGNRIGASNTCNGDTVPAGVTGASVIEAASIGPSNRLDAATVRDVFGGEHQYTYGYDATGALATKTEAPNTQHPSPVVTSYSYDAYGNLRHVTLPGGRQIDYLIDAANRRVGKLANGVRVQGFLYQDAIRPIAELDVNNNVSGIFVYGSKGNVPDYIERGDTRYRLISDNVGSVRLVINTTTGAIEQRLDYDEYGNVIQDTNPGFQPFGFAGGLYDPDTKLVRFGARDYDAETGRWTGKDPMGFRGGLANVYSYVSDDPVNATDPSGLRTYVCVYYSPAFGIYDHGHTGIGFDWTRPAPDAPPATQGFYPLGSSLGSPGALLPDRGALNRCTAIETTDSQELAVQRCLDDVNMNPGEFSLFRNNCSLIASHCLRSAGLPVPPIVQPYGLTDWLEENAKNLTDPEWQRLHPPLSTWMQDMGQCLPK